MKKQQRTFFENERLTLEEALAQTTENLSTYGQQYRHWAIAYSGGKDSSATVAAICYLLANGQIPAPESLTILYADTRQELPPLWLSAQQMLTAVAARGHRVLQVLPDLDNRFFVYMFGRGVPPPNNATLRWCTDRIKIRPMDAALSRLSEQLGGEKFLLLTGVRTGESAARDRRISVSCSRNGAECGQGWFQLKPPSAASDTLAPLLHWRVCHVWDWLTFETSRHQLPTQFVAEAYGGDEAQEINARTGCIGCPLTNKETALENIISLPQWSYLAPLRDLKPLYRELRERRDFRLRKDGERLKDGSLSANPNRLGPLTMEARSYGLARVLDVQHRVNQQAFLRGRPIVSLINPTEHRRILELQQANTWPDRWIGDEPRGDMLLDKTFANGVVQPLLDTDIIAQPTGIEGVT